MKPAHTRITQLERYITRDGSGIRELMHPDHHAVSQQSLAEAVVSPGEQTQLHRHQLTEELYHILEGEGEMTLGSSRFVVHSGDTVSIAPGTAHCIRNTGDGTLRFLCCCSPAYQHDDTELLANPDD